MDAARQPLTVRICPACERRFLGNQAKKKHRYGPDGAHCKPDHILWREGMVQIDGVWRKGSMPAWLWENVDAALKESTI